MNENQLKKGDLKDWSNKLEYHPLQWKAIKAVARIIQFAKRKYGNVNSWRERDEGSYNRYLDALQRHMIAHINGELIDPESGETHLAHCAWNALALAEFAEEDIEKGVFDAEHLSIQR